MPDKIPPYCDFCDDNCADPEDPTGQADCRHCGGSFAWRQRDAYYKQQRKLIRDAKRLAKTLQTRLQQKDNRP